MTKEIYLGKKYFSIKKITGILMFLYLGLASFGLDVKPGQLNEVKIKSEFLKKNSLDFNGENGIVIYVPEKYNDSDKSYPVVYFLAGYSGEASGFANWISIDGTLNTKVKNGEIAEMIVVVLDGKYKMDGSFYADSFVSGEWEKYVTEEVVPFVDKNLRTIKDRNFRGISGHSMGGFGCLNIAMKYPDIFGSVYSLSPGLLDERGEMDAWFADEKIKRHLKTLDMYKSLPLDKAKKKMKLLVGDVEFETAYGMAFAPKTEFPYYEYPYTNENGEIKKDEVIMAKWKNGFGNLKEKTEKYKANLMSLKGIGLDVGMQDNYEWIKNGTIYYNKILNESGIKNQLNVYEGDHGNKIPDRVKEFALPFFDKIFKSGVK